MTARVGTARTARRGGWEAAALRGMELVASPALAGAAFCLLCLGVVTWLPALAALAAALHRWRTDGDARCFTGVLAAFPGYWRVLWRHGVAATVGPAAVLATAVFLAGRPEPVAVPLLAVQLGVLAAFVPYHLALAVVAGRDRDPAAAPAVRAARWRVAALVLAFGSPRRALTLLAAAVLAPVVTLPLAVGPFLLAPALAVLSGLALAERTEVGSGTTASR